MNRTVNDYIQANWDTIRSDLALNGEHSATFDAGHRTGEGFYNEGMYGAGPRSAHYGQTSYAARTTRTPPSGSRPARVTRTPTRSPVATTGRASPIWNLPLVIPRRRPCVVGLA
jgi:hypothetical protein